jgi:hypothetical protein
VYFIKGFEGAYYMQMNKRILQLIGNYLEKPREECPKKLRICFQYMTLISRGLCYNLSEIRKE